ncbi:MAG: hypothetical protein AAF623_22040, partial [Planctomycetota bacterium]
SILAIQNRISGTILGASKTRCEGKDSQQFFGFSMTILMLHGCGIPSSLPPQNVQSTALRVSTEIL